MIDKKDSLIRNKRFSSQYMALHGHEKETSFLIDFSKFTSKKSKLGLTDIDGFIIHDNNLILLECKKNGSEIPRGQKTLLKRIANMWNKNVGKCIVFKVEFSPIDDKQINLESATITRIYNPNKPKLDLQICKKNAKDTIVQYCNFFKIPKASQVINTLDGIFECDSDTILVFTVSEQFNKINLGVQKLIEGLGNMLEDNKRFLTIVSCISINGRKEIITCEDKPIFCLNETIPFATLYGGSYRIYKNKDTIYDIVTRFCKNVCESKKLANALNID